MSNAHAIANTFDAAGLTLAGVFHGCMEDARARQDAVDQWNDRLEPNSCRRDGMVGPVATTS